MRRIFTIVSCLLLSVAALYSQTAADQTAGLALAPIPQDSSGRSCLVVRAVPPESHIAVNDQEVGVGRIAYTDLKPGFYKISCSNGIKNSSFIVQLFAGAIYDTVVVLDQPQQMFGRVRDTVRNVFAECSFSWVWGGTNGHYASGPYTEIMVFIPKAKIRMGFDFHWGVMDEINYNSEDNNFSMGGFSKIQTVFEDKNRLIRFAIGGNVGFYYFDHYSYNSNSSYPYYYSDNYSTSLCFFGPSMDIMLGKKPAYFKGGYALLFGEDDPVHQFKAGINFLF